MARRMIIRNVLLGSVFLSTCVVFFFVYQSIQFPILLTVIPSDEDVYGISPFFRKQSGNATDYSREVLYTVSENKRKQERRLPNALVIGIRKGGTRAILEFLARHPSVKACKQEVHFFDRQENYVRGLNWYRDQMPLSFSNETTMEKTPAYFVTDDVPRKIFQMSPSIKLLVVVRDPTIRAMSDYAQVLENNNGSLSRSFESYVTEGPQHRILRKNSRFVTIGIYVDHLNKWLEYFPLKQIHFISGEELIKNPVHELKLVEIFLGLKPFFSENLFYYNATKGFFCLKSGCLAKSKGRRHPLVDEDVVKLLRDFYRPLNKDFYSAVGRNFGWS
ncbi:heparan sulfate glucosamine 3-O-sulfotransferase 5-like [Montipora foliosa]|uniref:heparan sulfate glucosamine 3-O-sulfotransferase 5-like n=1 Tax=Montipora foliosa TaxID=591990 RepID=UPI0035F1C696